MAFRPFDVHADPARARTMPADVYRDPEWFARQGERLWPRVWRMAPAPRGAPGPGSVWPWTIRCGGRDEPLLLTRTDDGHLRCLSNVCTHRGNVLVDRPGPLNAVRCGYHGRAFALDGQLTTAPGFEGCVGFPAPSDHLPAVSVGEWNGFTFAALDPDDVGFEEWIAPLRRRIDYWADAGELTFDADGSCAYEVGANWALYVDNYLEGFHIPFVHESLAQAIDFGSYRTEVFESGSVQIADARDDGPAFEPPDGHPDHGRRIAAWYFWLFPATMINVYPWGISVNRVEPLRIDRTRVVFERWVRDPSLLERSAGEDLDRVEREDEAVVEATWDGVRSRLYERGRLSPLHETGVHRFHRLMARYLGEDARNAPIVP